MFALARRGFCSYLGTMSLISRFNPAPAAADFWTEFRKPQPYRVPILLASFAATAVLIFAFTQESVKGPPVRPEVTYITSFAPDRTDEEIRAANIANQKRKDEIAELIAQREERKREMYRALGRASGMDVDAIEAEAAADRAAAEAAEAAQRERWQAQQGTEETAAEADTSSATE